MNSPPQQTYEPIQETLPIGEPFQCPAAGDAYAFTVRIRWVWAGGVWGRNDLKTDVAPYLRTAWDRVMAVTRETLRRFPPDLAAEAEAELNQRLESLAQNTQPAAEKARWIARAEVDPDPDVRDGERRTWATTMGSQSAYLAARSRVEQLRELILCWRHLLADIGLDDPNVTPAPYLAPYLLMLAAKPETAAETVMNMAARREQKDEELMKLLDTAVRGRGEVNLYEYDTAMDTALNRLMHWAGLKVPAGSSDD